MKFPVQRKRYMPQLCRSPCGERGLKLTMKIWEHHVASRSPCGERGLKSGGAVTAPLPIPVAPRAGSVG